MVNFDFPKLKSLIDEISYDVLYKMYEYEFEFILMYIKYADFF